MLQPEEALHLRMGHPQQPSFFLLCTLQHLQPELYQHSLPRQSTAGVAHGASLLQALVTAALSVSGNFAALENADQYMAHISDLANSWPPLAPAAAQLEEYQRVAGFRPMLTAAEMRQLSLLLQREAAAQMADKAHSEQQALALRRTALTASRQLCELQPGCAAYLLLLAQATSALQGSSATRQELEAFRAALQAAAAETGEAGGMCLR